MNASMQIKYKQYKYNTFPYITTPKLKIFNVPIEGDKKARAKRN